jgi:hypothetical protein
LTEKELWKGNGRLTRLKKGSKGAKTSESLWKGAKAAVYLSPYQLSVKKQVVLGM